MSLHTYVLRVSIHSNWLRSRVTRDRLYDATEKNRNLKTSGHIFEFLTKSGVGISTRLDIVPVWSEAPAAAVSTVTSMRRIVETLYHLQVSH